MEGLSTTAHPLNKLLEHQARWRWNQKCENAFQELKRQLASSTVLVQYDSQKPLRLATDASPYGVGAVLSHTMPDGFDWPIAFALTEAKRNYVQIGK